MTPEGREVRTVFFENYELDCRSGLLRRDGRDIKLQPQPARLLILLATRAGELVTRDEIRKKLWGDDTFVDFEHAINFSIKRIREALEENADRPRCVETVRRLGYRFIAETNAREPEKGEPERSPYPGLAGFSPGDSEFFFGREEEVQTLWGKLRHNHLLALIGPSGAGKTSLVQAGLAPSRPPGWRILICRPRESPFGALAQALSPELALDEDEIVEGGPALLREWRRRHGEVLLCIDAFEELFTLSDEATRAKFIELLSTASEEWGVHVLLAMRDDFLIHCHDHPGLGRVFNELTPLKPPRGPALRRALVEPAARCGYRFEDEALVADLLTEVTNERGALPLLAFAAARLWEKRDQARNTLARESYLEIGGVGGALARHADETLVAIGPDGEPVVREIFRNLTTANGTRVAQSLGELLSVFEDRESAAAVLGKLIDARLLTSFQRSGTGQAGSAQQVEIIHETLLSSWPRLVRWQAQDAEGAALRDQLRQAARAWQERGRPADLLWTGTSFRELALWRERYPGGLTTSEEAFVDGSTRLAERTRRRRRIVVGALLAASIAAAAITSSLWRQAKAEALRAEASKLLALGQSELETYPTAALAYAIKSLELTDTEVGRLFALRVLQRGPTATLTPLAPHGYSGEETVLPAFSPNGEWLAFGGWKRVTVFHRSGPARVVLGDYQGMPEFVNVAFGRESDILMANQFGDIRVWAIPDGRELRRARFEEGPSGIELGGEGFVTLTAAGEREFLRRWPFDEGEPRLVGSMGTWEGEADVAKGQNWRTREVETSTYDLWMSGRYLPGVSLSTRPTSSP